MSTNLFIVLFGAAILLLVYFLYSAKLGEQDLYETQERDAMPSILANASLHLSEYTLRMDRPLPLVAKVDQVFELPSKELILMETKTRYRNQAYAPDIIELSVQAAVIRHSNDPRVKNRTVLPYAYVRIKAPARKPVFIRVDLLNDEQLHHIYQRRLGLQSGKVQPAGPQDTRICTRCPQKPRCPKHKAAA